MSIKKQMTFVVRCNHHTACYVGYKHSNYVEEITTQVTMLPMITIENKALHF